MEKYGGLLRAQIFREVERRTRIASTWTLCCASSNLGGRSVMDDVIDVYNFIELRFEGRGLAL